MSAEWADFDDLRRAGATSRRWDGARAGAAWREGFTEGLRRAGNFVRPAVSPIISRISDRQISREMLGDFVKDVAIGAVVGGGTRAAFGTVLGVVAGPAGVLAGGAGSLYVEYAKQIRQNYTDGIRGREVIKIRDGEKMRNAAIKGLIGASLVVAIIENSDSFVGRSIGERFSRAGQFVKDDIGSIFSGVGKLANGYATFIHDTPIWGVGGLGDNVIRPIGSAVRETIKDKPFFDKFAVESPKANPSTYLEHDKSFIPRAEDSTDPARAVLTTFNSPDQLGTVIPELGNIHGHYANGAASWEAFTKYVGHFQEVMAPGADRISISVYNDQLGETFTQELDLTKLKPEELDPFDGYHRRAYEMFLENPDLKFAHDKYVEEWVGLFKEFNGESSLIPRGNDWLIPHNRSYLLPTPEQVIKRLVNKYAHAYEAGAFAIYMRPEPEILGT